MAAAAHQVAEQLEPERASRNCDEGRDRERAEREVHQRRDPQRAAYIATTIRNVSTLEAFVAAVRGHPGGLLRIDDVTEEVAASRPQESSVRFLDLEMLADRRRVLVHRITPRGLVDF
jgi:hypothetical protein